MTMEKTELLDIVRDFVDNTALNRVSSADAIRPDLAGFRMYGQPLIGFAAANDPYFDALRRPDIIGPHFRLPEEWLPGAQSVLSIFAPFTKEVIDTNRLDPEWPSAEWLHARFEGQTMINALCMHLVQALEKNGHQAIAPALHADFKISGRQSRTPEEQEAPSYTSNWSERHVAHIAGLGTFGLSAALITRMGASGRIGSIVTTCKIPADARPYTRHDEYCNKCGTCVRRCPVSAISFENGKDKHICSIFLDRTEEAFAPRYGCGKCYVSVPCERRIPGQSK